MAFSGTMGQQAMGQRHGVNPRQAEEGGLARMIEEKTSQLPSDLFLWAAGGSIVGSLILQTMGEQKKALFVGQWAPTLLVLGLYNKLVKIKGSE